MSILPYSFCRDDTEKKTLRHGFLLGMMTAVVLLVPFLFVGGIILVNVVRGSAYAEESPPVSEDVMIPYSVEPQPENNEMIPKDQVIQAVPIGEGQLAQRAVPQGSITAHIPLPSAAIVSPVVQQASVIAAQYPPVAPSEPPEEVAVEHESETSVLTEGLTFSDRRIAYFGGQDVPTGKTGR